MKVIGVMGADLQAGNQLGVWDPNISLLKSKHFPGEHNWNFKMWWWWWSASHYHHWRPVNWAAALMSLEHCWLVLHPDLTPWPSVIFIILFHSLSWCFAAPSI